MGDQWIARLTPEAGSIKTGQYRGVPLHPQIIQEDLVQFVQNSKPGPLFHHGTDPSKYAAKATQISNRLAEWLRDKGLVTDARLGPTHAWRHRFKTPCRDLGKSNRVVDAIQGHAGRTAAEKYGDMTLKTKIDPIKVLSSFDL